MDSQTIRTALGKLQAEPDSEQAWSTLTEEVAKDGGDIPLPDLLRLLESARDKHAARGEWTAVAGLFEVAAKVAEGTDREPEVVSAQAKALSEELFDEDGAAVAYMRLLELRPKDAKATAAIKESEDRRNRQAQLKESYLSEAGSAPDEVYKSSMLMRAAEIDVRFAGDSMNLESVLDLLEQAVRLDPTNERAVRLLEMLYRREQRWEEVARVLERLADRGDTSASRTVAGVRLARLYAQHLSDNERAARAYDRVLRENADHGEAKEFLAEFFANAERWADLVTMYERELKNQDLNDLERLGDMLQIAMLHWRKLDKKGDAEPWFERIRRLEPTNEVMLTFFREFCDEFDDDARLIDVLQGAQRAFKDGSKEKSKLASEVAKLAEGQENAAKAIEQYKSVLRQDPDNSDSREALKRLYKQTSGYNALVELLRQQLERTPAEQYELRLGILREVATVYRQFIKSDTALLSVLNQIVQLDDKLDEQDVVEMRELVGLYEKLGRWRDLVTFQQKLAEITPDPAEKVELYRSAARRWLEQFSNAQHAADAYAALLKVEPQDREARDRLDELYRKRRAWPQLYDLYESELATAEGAQRLTLLREMATLAAERLNRGGDAVKLYKQILQADPGRTDVLDALEKHAERAKDWPALAEALEQRVKMLEDEAARLALLQKLGGVYAEHMQDHQNAIRTWRRVLELSPGHSRALRVLRESYLSGGDFDGLEDLYAAQNDWEGLADVLSNAADRSKDNAVRIDLSYRAARVYEEKLGQPERAFRSYDRILTTDPSDTRAARALIPLYEKDEKWARLSPLYELLFEKAGSTDEKLDLLSKLVEVTGRRLNDRRTAANFARKAYELAPDSRVALELLEDSARAAGAWESFVEALETRLKTAQDSVRAPAAAASGKKGKKKKKGAPEQEATPEPPAAQPSGGVSRRLLELKLARVYAQELGRLEDAIRAYKHVLERDPADSDAAAALEAILRSQDRRDDLRWLLELRVTNAPSDEDRAQILGDWATLEEDVFESPERAAEIYRRILSVVPTDRQALTTLPRLLLAAGDAAGAAEIIEHHRDQLEGDERAEREVDLAELYIGRLDRATDALESAVRALASTKSTDRAMDVLERLVAVPSVRARAAEILAQQYSTGGEARREADALRVLLDQTKNSSERLALYTRLADVHEKKLSSYGSALDVVLGAVREFPNEMSFWDRADRLASSAGRPTDLSEAFREVLRGELAADLETELAERAAGLHEDRLGDPIGATPYLERVLTLSPGNETAFQRLKDILTAAERWGELEALYDRASKATEDGARRIDMLVEVALICEEIIEDVEKATRYYERILEADPLHEVAIRALDRLYARQGKNKELAGLLEKRLETAVGDEIFELKLRLAKLQLDLLQPERAVLHVEDVLRERVNDYQARELAERMLEIGSLKARSARMLESVYEARDEIRDLVRVLSIRLETAEDTPEERRDLLRRIATLRDDRLHDDQGALDALAELVPSDPLDVDARKRLLEIGRRQSAHERVAEVLRSAADKADTPVMRGEILMQVATIFEDLLNDKSRAEGVYRRVLELDATDPELVLPASRALERIYVAGGDNERLAEMLKVQVKLEQDGASRRDLFGRLGALCQSVLGDNKGAIVAWRSRVEENPDDEQALAALDRLYEATESWRELVDVLERRREATSDSVVRRSLMTRSAETLWRRLEAVPEAIDAYQSLVGEFGPSTESLTALQALFQAAERWDDLGETYERHLDMTDSDSERLDLLAKLGDLKREHLSDVTSALEVYRRALSIDTRHAPSRSALSKLLDREDAVARREAAQILHPIYETEGDHERLLRILEIEVETSDDPLDKLQGLESALKVAEGPLGDSARAFKYAERAVRVAVGHTELLPWFAHLERLAGATGRQADYVKLLCDVVPEIFDGEVQLSVTLKIADLARHQLADRELARDYYKKALELRGEDAKALAALESLYEESGDAQNLLEILERRVDVAESDDEKKQLLYRRARLLSDVLEDKKRAISVYETILDLGLEPSALTALENLYAATSMWVELIELYERQLAANLGNESDLHVAIARVASRHQSDVPRAFDELEAALSSNRQHEGAIAEIERLLAEAPEPEHRARAAELLEPVYLARADFNKVMDAIRARLEASADPSERRELLQRLAQLYEEQKEDYKAALETIARLLSDDLSDERTQSELERLAKVASAEERLAEIYAAELEKFMGEDASSARLSRRTGELWNQIGQYDKALVFLRRALAFEPDSKELFSAIDGILTRTERHEERVALYRDALEHRFEPADRLQALHTTAALQRKELGRPDDAIETYRAALDVDETDVKALDSLGELYAERERFDDLAELYLRRAESADSPERAGVHRLALAKLHVKQNQLDRAIDQLEEIVRTLPGQSEAIAELENLRRHQEYTERVVEILRPLYESLDDWKRQIQLNEDRFTLARDAIEKVAVLRETAELWEKRGNDPDRARRSLEAAFKLEPDDPDVRAEYERLSSQVQAWDELAEAYDRVLEARPELRDRREILAVLAKVHNEKRDDPRRALNAFERLYAVDQSDVEPLNKMELLATLLSDWAALVRVLTAKADLLLDDSERASVWRRAGEAKRDMLEDPNGAIADYERALELDPQSAFTVDCLIDLYEGKGDPARLVELYQRRVELSDEDDADLKYSLLINAAACYERELSDRSHAIEMLQQALGVRPGDQGVLASLNRLYRAESMWRELLDNLRLEASSAPTGEERATLRKEIGSILADKLESYEDALDAYRLALDEAPRDTSLVEAVRTLGSQHEDLRRTVAEILIPVLRQTERYEELVGLLEMRLTVETDPSERTETLGIIAEVLETRLGKTADAEAALLRAVSERPEDAKLHTEIERLAAASGGWPRYADTLSERAGATFDPELAKDLFVRLGRIAESRLDDETRAVEAYERAVEQAGDHPELLDALDRLYTRLESHKKVAEILDRRVVAENSEQKQADLYFRLATLQISKFGEPSRGLGSLRMALERAPEHDGAAEELEKLTDQRELFEEASEVLEGVYRSRGRTDRLAKLYEKRVGFAESPDARIDMRKSLARVLEEDVGDASAAQRVLQQGLVDSPTDSSLLDELERLAPLTKNWEGACAALWEAIQKRGDLTADAVVELCVRLAGWQRDRAEDQAAAERSLLKALEVEPESDEVLVLLEQLQRAPGREADLLTTLRRRAKLSSDPERREDLYRQAKALADSKNDADSAEAVLRELIAQDDASLWALSELSKLRQAAGDYKETFALLVRQAELGADAAAVRVLRRRAAEIARDQLADTSKAIELFEQLFEDEPNDRDAASALRRMYASAERFQDLGRLLERLVDMAESAGERSALRLELSKLNETEFNSPDTAINLLKTLLDEEPGHGDAVVQLSELYEKTKRDEELAELLTSQIKAASDRGDTTAELKFQVRLGEVYDSRLGDRDRAIETYKSVLERDARHRGALQALARLYQSGSMMAEAASVLDQLLDMSSGEEAVTLATELGEAHQKLGAPDKAAAALERGLSQDERNEELRSGLRGLYEAMSDWQRLATLVARDAEIASSPEESVKLFRQAAAIHGKKRNDHAAAADLLDRASKLKPDDRELLLELCDEYSASGRGKAAAEVLVKIVESYGTKRTKELGEIHRRLASAYIADGETQKALEELDKAFRIEPGNINVLTQLGDVAIKVGDFKKAQQMYRALLLQRDTGIISKSVIHMRLGEVHEKLGEKDRAVQSYERAVQMDASLEEAKTRLAALKR